MPSLGLNIYASGFSTKKYLLCKILKEWNNTSFFQNWTDTDLEYGIKPSLDKVKDSKLFKLKMKK